MNSTSENQERSGSRFPEFYDGGLLKFAAKHMTWIAGFTVAFLALGLVYLALAPRVYRAKATLQVAAQDAKVLNIADSQGDVSGGRDASGGPTLPARIATIENTLQSRSLYVRVIQALELERHPEFLKPGATQEELVQALEDSVKVSTRKNTLLIDVSAEHHSREMAKQIVETLVSEYKAQNAERRGGANESAAQFLAKESERLQASLQQSETRLQEFQEQHHSVAFDDDKDNTIVDRLKKLNLDVTQARTERVRAEADMLAIEARYKKKHPKYVQAVNGVEKAKAVEASLLASLNEQEQTALQLNRESIQYGILQRQVESDKALYEVVLKRLKEINVAKAMDLTAITVVDEPYASSKAVRPQPMFVLLSGLLCGLLAGFIAALSRNVFDSSIQTISQAERLFQVPVLTAIPPSGVRNAEVSDRLVVLGKPHSAAAEAFRFLTTSLGLGMERKVVLFTSAVPNEGKTFTSCNYAAMLAKQGLQTLLIQADIKHQTLQDYFPVISSSPGLSEYLEGTGDLNHVTHLTGIERLFVIPAGEAPMMPAERFARERWADLIDKMSASFDRIVIDTAPVNLVSNTLTFAQNVPTVIMVAEACKTPARVVSAAYHRLLQSEIQISGVVLNRFPLENLLGDYSSYYSDDAPKGFFKRRRKKSKAEEASV